MAEPTNAEILAAWLIFAQRSGENGRIMPTDAEVKAILTKPPDRWDEARALAEALCERIVAKAPRTLVGSALDFAGEVNKAQEKIGNFFSTPNLERTK